MRRRYFHLLLCSAVAACGGSKNDQADGSVMVADADPNAPDANPNAPDADPQSSCAKPPVSGIPTLDVETVVSGLVAPVMAVVPPGESRIFVVQKEGLVGIVENGELRDPAFLDITNLILEDYNERGLLGIAFHPQYQTNKRFYVYYTAKPSGNLTISEYTASSANDGNAGSAKVLLSIPHPTNKNHNGGWIAFGPDGFLYAGTGDGGSGGDPPNNAQNKKVLLGKLLRLDVNTAGSYAIPDGNPFKGNADGNQEEIWAYGLRNPWRDTFDRKTGDLYIADVGQDSQEEIDVQPHGTGFGKNYGWRIMEGVECYNAASCNMNGLVLPIYKYDHSDFGDGHASITGGIVYRGCRMPDLQGTYFFGDAVHAFIRSLKWNGSDGATNVTDYPQWSPDAQRQYPGITPYSFGEDVEGEMLICDATSGSVFRVIPKQ